MTVIGMAGHCPLCKSPHTTLLTGNVRFARKADVRSCDDCTLVFLDQNSFQFPPDFYQREYHQTYLTHIEPDAIDPAKYHEKMLIASRPWVERIRSLLQGGETVLDVGCSTGHIMVGIKDKARAVFGHELNPKEAAFCRNQLGLEVDGNPLEKRFAPASFDYITLIFVLEHIAQPVEFLRRLKRFLKPGGKFVILVPNIDDPLLKLYAIPAFREFYYCIEHLFYYSPRTLGRVLETAGLSGRIETVQEYPLVNHLNWAIRGQPSDTLAARSTSPVTDLHDKSLERKWEQMWTEWDAAYRAFLANAGYSDRIWCIAEARS